MNRTQSTDTVVMIRPVRFAANAQTAVSNAFQKQAATEEQAQVAALAEFEALAGALRGAGVKVLVYDDTPEPHTPDAIFPNNWFSTHHDGTVVLYPMQAENRRFERRMDVIEALRDGEQRQITRLIDLSGFEAKSRFLEGTGSLVLDRINHIAYACYSPRTDETLLQEWGEELGYEVVGFHAADGEGRAIYHTNVLMCMGDAFAVICGASIPDSTERKKVFARLAATEHEIVDISLEQMGAFAGNMLLVKNDKGENILAMSRRAHEALTPEQQKILERHAKIVSSPIPTIEDAAGGSVRCMLAEVFLPAQRSED